MSAAMIIATACTTPAGPAATPGATGTAVTPTEPAGTEPTGTEPADTPPAETPDATAEATPEGTPSATATGEAPTASPEGTPAPQPDETPSALTADLTEYPNYGGEVDCEAGTFNGLAYTGNLKKITAIDPQTVEFEFCNPQVAFLSQIAFSSLGIDDAQYLIDNMPTAITGEGEPLAEGSLLVAPNGTGPYTVGEWDRGNRMLFSAYPDYWGDAPLTPNLEFRWSDQAAQRTLELQSGTVDGIDNPGKDDIPAIEGDENLRYFERVGLNTLYLGMNNTIAPWDDPAVRKAVAMGIDRQRIVDTFYAPGSQVASHFTPCEIDEFACEGTAWDEAYAFDQEAAIQALRDAGIEEGFPIDVQYRAAVRGYLPDPPAVAQDVAAQLTDLGFTVTIEEQESGTFLDNNAAGTLDGIFLLGWGADFPDTSNFLDFHFGPATGDKFGDEIPELVDAIRQGGQTVDPAERAQFYGTANDLLVEHVPMIPVAHGASGAAFKADVENAFAAPLLEEFSVMRAADRDTLVWMQNAEPLSLYCGDESDGETLRACEQVKESLYGYETNGTAPEPKLAEECVATSDTVWTCTLREGVTFHDGSTFDASDVIVSFAAQWDALSPQHVGRSGAFEYWPAMIGGGYLNG
jgi:ABC-type transport system substrate-binding protein